ncbi:vesicle transport protein SFT2B-like [Solea senegalensis]|uniref:Vesicle transport protein n=1 Tax=Solea senegalensis TaxID=28829 RepID=A0AAV6RD54_SOLSE|nr:vesicle transport protein SFT2B-like isoform X1 [Solea senegalensis]KAG7503467.1 vesicle transport protein SFT2B-like [Solea senegalensis]
MDKLRKVLKGEDEDENTDGAGVLERVNEASTLGWGTRVRGFLVCLVLGAFFCVLATFMLWIPGFGLAVFVVFYTIGNICALTSSMFLVGPCRQLRSMCAKERALATVLMVVCLVLTMCSAYWWTNFTLALIFCILQILAFIWYGLSYVPYARETFVKVCSVCCC